MKKLITPLLYLVAILPVFSGVFLPTILIYGFLEQFYDVRGLELWLALILFLIWGSICFWAMNMAMAHIEHMEKPLFLDHLRQSFFYYLLLPLAYCAVTPFYGGLAQVYALVILAGTCWAILLNAVFLIRKSIYFRS